MGRETAVSMKNQGEPPSLNTEEEVKNDLGTEGIGDSC